MLCTKCLGRGMVERKRTTAERITVTTVLRDVAWLIECEADSAETNGYDTRTLENLKQRISGHFGT